MSRPPVADRTLHRLALQSRRFREFCFAGECARNDYAADRQRPNVFIAGVARAGSTALLNAIHASGDFAATTYSLMPLVLAPSLARRIAWLRRRPGLAAERAHGDGIRVEIGSPEALDGIFWSTFLPPDESCLGPREVPLDILRGYARFVENLLAQSAAERYLTKMNQGIDKLAALAGYFDRSVFLLPFREPLQQAASLARQHRNFAVLSGYERQYFEWLGHSEFGAAHKPFVPAGGSLPASKPDDIEYWLRQWHDAYAYLAGLAESRSNLLPLCYEQLAASPASWESLSQRLGTTVRGDAFVDRNALPARPVGEVDGDLRRACDGLYTRLRRRSEQGLSWPG